MTRPPYSNQEAPRARVRAADLKKGLRVWVPKLRAEAEVIEVTGTTVRVAAGALKLAVQIEELRAGSTEADREVAGKGTAAKRAQSAPRPDALEPAIQTSDNSCDLRGLRADDALSLANTFLDRSLNAGRRVAFLILKRATD